MATVRNYTYTPPKFLINPYDTPTFTFPSTPTSSKTTNTHFLGAVHLHYKAHTSTRPIHLS